MKKNMQGRGQSHMQSRELGVDRIEGKRQGGWSIWYERNGQEAGSVISGQAVRNLEYHGKELHL